MTQLKFISLFSGIGGIDLGLERAGLSCVAQVELNNFCTRILTKHWPTVPKFRDIKDVGKHNLPYADVIAGGFPCQDISYSGLGDGIYGKRSGLWFEFARIICEMEPRYVLVENVSALLTRGIDHILGTLAALRYDAEWHCIPAAAFGAPHIRDRVFILAYSTSVQLQNKSRTRANTTGYSSKRALQKQNALLAEEQLTRTAKKAGSWFSTPECTDQWATEPAVGRVVDGISARMDRLRGLGNAVVPHVAEYLGNTIRMIENDFYTTLNND